MPITDYFGYDVTFEYNKRKKIVTNILLISILAIIIAFVIYYLNFLKNVDFFIVNALNNTAAHIIMNIKSLSLLGSFYASFFGGLFFIFMSIEAVYITFLTKLNPTLLFFVYLGGLTLAYTTNYYIGYNLAGISKRIITPSKFYKTKSLLNRYGDWAIFAFYVLPLPSQPLTAMLGVFKYRISKFYAFFLIGQIIKFIAITIIFGLVT